MTPVFDTARDRLGSLSQPQVDSINLILDECVRRRLPKSWVSYILATVEGECKFKPVEENLNYSASGLRKTFSAFADPAIAKRYARKPEKIANRAYADRMGNGDEESGDGWLFRGRGFVQLTGRDNYDAMSDFLGKDFVGQPDLALKPMWATSILIEGMVRGMFTSRKLGDYLGDGKRDWKRARKVIHGGMPFADAYAKAAVAYYGALSSIDMLAESRTIKEAKGVKREAAFAGGGIALASADPLLDAVTQALSDPEAVSQVSFTASTIETVFPWLGFAAGVVALALIVRSAYRAQKIEAARIDDHARGVR